MNRSKHQPRWQSQAAKSNPAEPARHSSGATHRQTQLAHHTYPKPRSQSSARRAGGVPGAAPDAALSREPITAALVIRECGSAHFQAAVGYGRHHHDDAGELYWTPDAWDTISGLMAIEEVTR